MSTVFASQAEKDTTVFEDGANFREWKKNFFSTRPTLTEEELFSDLEQCVSTGIWMLIHMRNTTDIEEIMNSLKGAYAQLSEHAKQFLPSLQVTLFNTLTDSQNGWNLPSSDGRAYTMEVGAEDNEELPNLRKTEEIGARSGGYGHAHIRTDTGDPCGLLRACRANPQRE